MVGVESIGETRQSSFVDFDNDGDLDLFVALRDGPNTMFRNDGLRFIDAGRALGLDDTRRTVGAVWFDMDQDGDLDVFVANQNGDLNGLFRNDGTRFVDVAGELGMDAAGRAIAAVDSRGGQVVIHGWRTALPITAVEAVRALEPYCGEFLYTHVDTEGLMQGTDVDAILAVRAATTRRVTAAGGITTWADIDRLDAAGVDAVVGMAIYPGQLPLERGR
jgi:hypothetical protein